MEQYVDKSIWPGWETLRLLGRGSYGAVYEVRRQVGDLEEHAAVKCLSIPRDPGEIRELRFSGFDEESLSRHFTELKDKIQQEYETMLRLKGSPNIVACEDLRVQQQADGVGWDIAIRMELLTPLMEGMGRTVDEEQVLRLGVDMARALSCCHRKNIVHRDVKPQNIFLDRQGNYKLGDFGVARTMEGTGSATMRTGTYRYMAPEVFNGRHYGPRADLYSLGLVLYWLLNDRRSPFVPGPPHIPRVEDEERARARRFAGEPLPPPTHGSDRLKRIVQKLCAYDPQDRFSSAEELLRVLENNAGFGIRNSESEKDRRTFAPVGAAVSRPPAADPGPRTNGAVGALHEAPDSTGLELAVSAAGAAVSRPPVASTAQHAPEAAKAEASTPVRRPHPPQAVPLPLRGEGRRRIP
jgi:serine/threonine protein kinase